MMSSRLFEPFKFSSLFFLTCGLAFGFSSKAVAAQPGEPVAVSVTPVKYVQTARTIHTSGRLEYKSIQRLSFKTGGPVASITVDEGDAVTAGQLLAALETEEIDARLAEAESRHANAKDRLKRLQNLQHNMVSDQQVQAAQTERDVAASHLRIARFNHRYSRITAPASGHIVRRAIEPSELVTPNQTVFELADESKGWVIRTGLADRDIVRVKPGDQASIRFDAWPDTDFMGVVSSISPTASISTGTFDVEITLNITSRRLYQGLIGRITITPQHQETVAYLPLASLTSSRNGMATVLTVNSESGTAETASVRMLYLKHGQAVISDDSTNVLPESALVITQGATLLKAGDPVQVADNKVAGEQAL
ncbi:efflux RND transporter periplasmic adaptor subunit [Spongorhabdus nitratireducens]